MHSIKLYKSLGSEKQFLSSRSLLHQETIDLIRFAFTVISLSASLAEVLPLNAARASTTERTLEGEVNVLLGVETYNE